MIYLSIKKKKEGKIKIICFFWKSKDNLNIESFFMCMVYDRIFVRFIYDRKSKDEWVGIRYIWVVYWFNKKNKNKELLFVFRIRI